MSMMWVGIAGIAVGAAGGIYGANKQSGAVKDAANQNAASQAQQNQAAWANYLMTRGLNPAGAVTGQIPQSAQAINSRLPLWANVTRQGTVPAGFRLGGAGGGPKLAIGGTQFTQPAPVVDPSLLAGGAGGGGMSTLDKLRPDNALVTALNPAGIGGKDKSWHDPLGIF